jgi:glutamate 5-kinase
MYTKIEAAYIATQSGTKTIIAPSSEKDVLLKILEGNEIGTLFKAHITPRESRKRWLLSEKPQGYIYVDEGASTKILHGGASLLPSGITHLDRSFERGAIVHIRQQDHTPIASGITNYSSKELEKLIGQQSKQIEELLGYSFGEEIIHRSNMTRFKGHVES